MNQISLSYVLTTRNKLPYLKEVLPALIAAKKDDEEILIADGASTDGTPAYLQELQNQDKIDYFISEPDKGEAHGFNKLMARSHGELIKLITDDDAFCYPGIEKCREFMLAHGEIDFLSTEGVKRRNIPAHPFSPMASKGLFENWRQNHRPFAFCGLGIMLRRSSLPLLGYLHTSFVRVDAEYALRVTASKARIAWYTGEVFAHILNENSNSITRAHAMVEEMDKLETLFLGKHPQSAFEKKLRALLRPIKHKIKNKQTPSKPLFDKEAAFEQWREMYHSSVAHLYKNEAAQNGTFLT